MARISAEETNDDWPPDPERWPEPPEPAGPDPEPGDPGEDDPDGTNDWFLI